MVHELIAQEEDPIPLEKQQGTESWIYMYTNEKYQIGLGTTMSLFKLRNLFNFLHEKNFIPFISETEVEKLARTNIFELKNNLANIDTLFNTVTTKKHIFNDGDNVALNMINNKIIFGDSLFTFLNLYEALNIAVYKFNSLNPSSKIKP